MVIEENRKRKRLLAVVFMIIIMLLSLILMMWTYTLGGYTGYRHGGSNQIVPVKKEVDALMTFALSPDITLYVTGADMSKQTVGNNYFYDIESEKETSKVTLDSVGDTTVCRYNVIFTLEDASIENKYTTPNGALAILRNQLILKIKGYNENDSKSEEKTYEIDVLNLSENKYTIENIYISNNQKDSATEQTWEMSIAFRNYRDYDQVNNAGKSAKGNIKYELVDCERVS